MERPPVLTHSIHRRPLRVPRLALTAALACVAAVAASLAAATALGWTAAWGTARALAPTADPTPLARLGLLVWLSCLALCVWSTIAHPSWSRRMLADRSLVALLFTLAAALAVPMIYGDGLLVLSRLAGLLWRLLLTSWIYPVFFGAASLAAVAVVDWHRESFTPTLRAARNALFPISRRRLFLVAAVIVVVASHAADLATLLGPGALGGLLPQPYDLIQLVPRVDAGGVALTTFIPIPSSRVPFLAYWIFTVPAAAAAAAAAPRGHAAVIVALVTGAAALARLLPAGIEGYLALAAALAAFVSLVWQRRRGPRRCASWIGWHAWALAALLVVAFDLRWSQLLLSLNRPLPPDAQEFLASASSLMGLPRFGEKWYVSSHLGLVYASLNPTHGGALFVLFTWLMDQFFGLSRVPIALLSLLSSVALVAATFALGRQWFGRTTGVLAASFLALSSPLARQSAYGLREELTALATTIALVLLFSRPGRGSAALSAAVCMSVAILTRLETALPLAVAFGLAVVMRRWPVRRIVGGALVAVALVGPLLVGYAINTGDPLRPINATARVDSQNELEAPSQGLELRSAGPAIDGTSQPAIVAWYFGRRSAVEFAAVTAIGAAEMTWDTLATPEQLWPFRLFGPVPPLARALGCATLLFGAALSARRAWPLLLYGAAAAAPYVVRHGLGLWEERLAFLLHPVVAVLVASALLHAATLLARPLGRLRAALESNTLFARWSLVRRAPGLT